MLLRIVGQKHPGRSFDRLSRGRSCERLSCFGRLDRLAPTSTCRRYGARLDVYGIPAIVLRLALVIHRPLDFLLLVPTSVSFDRREQADVDSGARLVGSKVPLALGHESVVQNAPLFQNDGVVVRVRKAHNEVVEERGGLCREPDRISDCEEVGREVNPLFLFDCVGSKIPGRAERNTYEVFAERHPPRLWITDRAPELELRQETVVVVSVAHEHRLVIRKRRSTDVSARGSGHD